LPVAIYCVLVNYVYGIFEKNRKGRM